jgi:hypothetical protein
MLGSGLFRANCFGIHLRYNLRRDKAGTWNSTTL